MRLAQYVLLGIGGVRALRALGIEPGVVHLNEGHAALAPVQLRLRSGSRRSLAAGIVAARRERIVFTTHTRCRQATTRTRADRVKWRSGG